MGFAEKIYWVLLATAMLLPFFNLYQLLINELNPITTIIIWEIVVSSLFFMEFLSSAIKRNEK